MDDPGLDPAAHRAALAALARIHRVTGTLGTLWGVIAPLLREAQGRGERLTVLDVACGGGDLLLAMERRARAAGLDLELEGADLSPVALEHAREGARAAGSAVTFRPLDALEGELPERDVLLATLFLHHLGDRDALCFLARMARAARRAIVVHDLARGRLGHVLAWAGTRLLTRSPVVRADGPLSVRNAFTPREALALARCAGLEGARVRRAAPSRWTLVWRPPGLDAGPGAPAGRGSASDRPREP